MRRGSSLLFLNKNQTTVIHLFFSNFAKEQYGLNIIKFIDKFSSGIPIIVHRYKCIERNTILLVITLKVIKMQYFEQLRLLFILFMAYLSYRKLNSTYENPCDDFAIQSEQEDDGIIEEEIKGECLAEQEVVNKENAVDDVENKDQDKGQESNRYSDNEIIIISFERKSTEETAEINEDSQDSQEESEQNQSTSLKSIKTKTIRKQPRKAKKKASVQTIITSENQQSIDLEEFSSSQKEEILI